jgi:hypothetical protein
MWDAVPMIAEGICWGLCRYDHYALKSRIHSKKPCLLSIRKKFTKAQKDGATIGNQLFFL